MQDYLKADLNRLFHRVPIWIVWALFMVGITVITVIFSWQEYFNYASLGDEIELVLSMAVPLLVAFQLNFIFEEDLQAKTMQIVLGRGLERRHLILAKWLEMAVFVLVDILSIELLMLGIGAINGVFLKSQAIMVVLAASLSSGLLVMVMVSILMIFIYRSLHLGVGQLIFLLLCFRPLSRLAGFLVGKYTWLASVNLESFFPGFNLVNFAEGMKAGTFHGKQLMVVLIYLVLDLLLACRCFKKKELDF